MPPTTRRMSRTSTSIHSPTSSELPTIPTIDESMHSTGTPPTPDRPVDTPTLQLEHDQDQGHDHVEAIHEHIVEHVTRALHREDIGIWSGSDEEAEGEENEGNGNSDEEQEEDDDEDEGEEEGGVKIDKAKTVTIEMSGDNLYMGTGEHSSSNDDDASEASSTLKGDDAAGEASSTGTPSTFASEEETAADAEEEEEEEDEGGITIQDSAPPSRRNRKTAPSVMMRSINRAVATTMPNPPTRSLTSTAPALPMILQPTESEDTQVKLPKDRHIADSDLEWMYLAPLDGAKRTVKYICANLGNSGLEEHETEVSFGEPMRCKTCACRVLWKKRTERMVQFEAR